jgi:SEC-C motif-containing protein
MVICPCGSGLELDVCCGPIVDGAMAISPEALMRSRYSAFALGNIEHIARTHAPEIGDDFNRAEAERAASEVEWLGLEVISSSETGDEGVVEFYIRFRRDGQEFGQHERAVFRRDEGRWLYVSGKVGPRPPLRLGVKTGRNDPCPCQSGKKFKKCCGA